MRKRTSEKQLLKNIHDALVILPILTKSDEFNLVQLEKLYILPRAFKQALFELGILEEKNQKISFVYPHSIDEKLALAVLERARDIKNPSRSRPKEESKSNAPDLFSINNQTILEAFFKLEKMLEKQLNQIQSEQLVIKLGIKAIQEELYREDKPV